MSVNYEYKSYILGSNYLELYKILRKSYYNLVKDYNLTDKEREVLLSTGYINKYPELSKVVYNLICKFECFKSQDILEECKLLYNSMKQRQRRLKNRVASLISKPSIFLTLTWSPSTLSSTTFEERRKIICRFLKKFGVPYVANIDFGTKNGREHYHAILQKDSISLDSYRKYGSINVKKIISSSTSCDRLSKYINKLTNHAIKNTASRYAIIYSR